MKKFKTHRSLKEIKAACKENDFEFSDEKYKQGSDHVSFTFKHESTEAFVLFNTFNGRAFGTINKGTKNEGWFSTDSDTHESEPWFNALSDFIYVPLDEPKQEAVTA